MAGLVIGLVFAGLLTPRDGVTTQTTMSGRLNRRLLLAGLVVGVLPVIKYIEIVSASIYYLALLGAGVVIFGSVALALKRPLLGGTLLIVKGL